MKNKSFRPLTNIGFSTILLAFSMICIVTFSALALITANSDYQLSQKVATKSTNYYLQKKKLMKQLQSSTIAFRKSIFQLIQKMNFVNKR